MNRSARIGAAAMACATLACGPAMAQDLPFGDGGEEVTMVQELVVRAFGGPAWWKVSDAGTTVYILASPGPVPKDVTWDTKRLNFRLEEAN